MEKEYIERELAEKTIDRFEGYLDDDMIFRIKYALRKHIPAADVAPVKHGHWYNSSYLGDEITCSECSATYNIFETDGAENFDYCPNCGAKLCRGE